MAEYINKAELIDKVLGETDVYYDFEVAGLVEDFPAIDIVHCSECIHAKLNWADADGEYYCARHQDVFVKDYYCADGERFGDNNE